MLGKYEIALSAFAGLLLASAQIIYVINVVQRKINPSLFTWAGWSILVGIALASQLNEYGWTWTLTGHLFSAVGCFVIFLTTLFTKNYNVNKHDLKYLYLGVACTLIYMLTSDPWLTTGFAILSDAILGIPTLLNALKNPNSEKSFGWNLALISWSLTILTCFDKNLIYLLFPLYCLLFNMVMTLLTLNRRIKNTHYLG